MKLAALVILYHPPENVMDNIASYYDEVDQLFVFDNTESKSCAQLFTNLQKVVFLYDGENKGIASRLNEGCGLAAKAGFEWMMTMDQDSRFPQHTFSIYQNCVYQYPNRGKVAVFGVQYKPYELPSTIDCAHKLTPFIITSGMLISLSVAKAIGGFDEQLFIDAVDHEYCIRANQNGYETVRFRNIFLHHVVGVPIKRASLKTLYLIKKAKAVHSPLRCYYMLRNSLYVAQRYGQVFPKIIAHNNLVVKMNLKRNFWYGRSAWQVFLHIQKAKRDFRNGKMGKMNNN